MRAIRMHTQGGPELLAYEDAPQPALQPGDALVRIIATSITKTELTWAKPIEIAMASREFRRFRDTNSPELSIPWPLRLRV
jgi:NADPH:quinone reductase-like Zn-dependent oxidoreductase